MKDGLAIAGIPVVFIVFGTMLAGIALFPKKSVWIAAFGLLVIWILSMLFAHLDFRKQFSGESSGLINLFGLLTGYSVLAQFFEDSHFPKLIPKLLPHDWRGPFILLLCIFIMSSFLDNIAAALIGGALATIVFKGKVHIGYLAAIVAAANAGGAGSVLGDTTTTMMWISGVQPMHVLDAVIAALPALIFFGIIGSVQQHRYNPMLKTAHSHPKLIYKNLVACISIIVCAIAANILFELPALGVWAAIGLATLYSKIKWEEARKVLPGSIFLVMLTYAASLLPVNDLPAPSWQTAFGLGWISSVLNNIPLTKLALAQSGYDWGLLAFAIGFGGSMIWFGSSAGVAITGMFPETESAWKWIRGGWHVIVAYVIGFFIYLGVLGWHPQHIEKNNIPADEQVRFIHPEAGTGASAFV